MARRASDPVTAFNALTSAMNPPMLIVTTRAGDERSGCLVGFATQTSIHPPRFLACLSRENHTYRLAQHAKHLAVHLVPADAEDLAELFGGETADEVDKLARCSWREGPGGVPLLDGCPSRFTGRVVARHDLGDHAGFLLEPVDAQHGPDRPLLPFQHARRIDPGHPA